MNPPSNQKVVCRSQNHERERDGVMGQIVPSANSHVEVLIPRTSDVTLFGNGIIANVISLDEE